MKNKKKKIVIVSEKDKDIFDEFLILIAGGLGALGIENLLNCFLLKGLLKLALAFLIILFVSSIIRKKSDKI